MGCSVVSPVAFVSLLSPTVGRLVAPGFPVYAAETITFYAIGGAHVAPKLVDKALPGHRSSRIRIVTKALLAVGPAIIAFPFVARPPDRLMTGILLCAVLIPYLAYEGATATSDCRGCPESDDFPNCTGMTFDQEYTYPEESTE